MQKINKQIRKYSNVSINSQDDIEKKIFNMMIVSLGVLALVYVFLISNIVFSIVERNSLNVKNSLLSSEVGELELEYLSVSQKIDLNFAYQNGFKETKTEFTPLFTSNNSRFAINENR